MDKKKEPEFVDRINNPDKYPFIENEDGSISTNRMAAERGADGNWLLFPKIVMVTKGERYEVKDNEIAMQYNLRTNNYLTFSKKEEALKVAEGGYKNDTPLAAFNPKQEQ